MSGHIMATPLSSLKAALWIVLVISTTVYARDWFGSVSQYKCHCNNNNNCGVSGDCTDECDKGWFGPQCQYVDLIYTENDGTTRTEFVDADDTTCNADTDHKQVVVTFKRTFPFTWLRLVISTEGLPLDSVDVTFTDGSGNNNIPCTNKRSALFDSRTIDIHCDVSVEVKKVSVIGDAIEYLCSFYVSGGRNVALKQPATQSTTQDGEPDKAVDGDINQQFATGWSCSHTGEFTFIIPVWTVTFSQIQAVNRFVIYNRGDCCEDRLLEFTLTSRDDNQVPVFSYHDSGTTALSIYIVTTVTQTSPVKSVDITTSYTASGTAAMNPILTLCEVEIYGDSICTVGKYGRECEHECHCTSNEKCFVSTGRCPNGCAVGYRGDSCDETCPETYYGANCLQRCSDKCVDRKCNISNGRCYECLPGFLGDFCDQACPATKYGSKCSINCSSNCMDGQCDAVSGVCTSCPSGKTGDLCDQNCPANKYGPRCINVCSTNCLNQLCDGNDGKCNQCPPGRQGAYCDQVCALGTYGDGCQERCNEDCDGCDPEDGKCSNGCISGYTGNMCDETCPYGKYGKGCLNDCSEFCNKNGTRQNESACHHVSGACLYACIQNYTGSKCDTKSTSVTTDWQTSNTTTTAPTTSVQRYYQCHVDSVDLAIPVSVVPNSKLHLKESSCQLQNNGTHHVLSFGYQECGTSVAYYTDYVYATNDITVESTLPPNGLVVFADDYTIPLECRFHHEQFVNGAFQAVAIDSTILGRRGGADAADFILREFRTELYQDVITEYPAQIPLNKELFVEIALANANGGTTGIVVKECKATPSNDDKDNNTYTLIQDGCPAQPTVQLQPNPHNEIFRFSLQAFHFADPINQNNMVYLHCDVSICPVTSCTSNCAATKRRRRRSIAQLVDTVTVSSGPYLLV